MKFGCLGLGKEGEKDQGKAGTEPSKECKEQTEEFL